jgi:Protein of unknown function with HXXEE motif
VTRRAAALYLGLVLSQAAHSVEEYVFRLYEVFAPARLVSGLFSDDLSLGFAAANAAIVAVALWGYLARVRPRHPSARSWAWFWTVLEAANGTGHLLLALARGAYFPGAATAPLLLGLAVALALTLRRRA